jgi:hypothetical protein
MGVDSMEAGRELDLLIARKVLGLKVLTWQQYSSRLSDPDPCIVRSREGLTINRKGGPHGQGWSPSEDIGDAVEVAEALRAKGFLYRVQRFPAEFKSGVKPLDGMGGASYCQFYGGCLGLQFEAIADTLELAICRAALKAVSTSEVGSVRSTTALSALAARHGEERT